MKRIAGFVAGILALGGLVGAWVHLAEEAQSVTPINQAWVTRMPHNAKDVVGWFIPMQHNGERYGVIRRNSRYWFAGQRFSWARQGQTYRLTFPQSDQQVQLKFKAYKCKKPQFDLCLDLEQQGRRFTLYSRSKWKVPPPKRSASWEPDLELTPLEGCTRCEDGDLWRLLNLD